MSTASTRLRHQLIVTSTMLALLLTSSQRAHAHDGSEGDWYGWQLMAVDVMSIAMLTVGQSVATDDSEEEAAVVTGLLGYTLGSPVVHYVHRRDWTSLKSLGLRIGLPVAGALATGLIVSADGDSAETAFFDTGWVVLGFGAGIVSAMIIDYAVLGHHPEAMATGQASEAQMLQLQWQF